MAKKWIQGAIKHPGALHKQLGVPQGKKIPAAKLEAAASKGGKLGQRARLAQTLKGMHGGNTFLPASHPKAKALLDRAENTVPSDRKDNVAKKGKFAHGTADASPAGRAVREPGRSSNLSAKDMFCNCSE